MDSQPQNPLSHDEQTQHTSDVTLLPAADSAQATVIESIGGTTAADNAESGNAAYIIAGVTVVLLFIVIGGIFSGIGMLMESAAEQVFISGDSYVYSGHGFDDDFFDDEFSHSYEGNNFEDLLFDELMKG